MFHKNQDFWDLLHDKDYISIEKYFLKIVVLFNFISLISFLHRETL